MEMSALEVSGKQIEKISNVLLGVVSPLKEHCLLWIIFVQTISTVETWVGFLSWSNAKPKSSASVGHCPWWSHRCYMISRCHCIDTEISCSTFIARDSLLETCQLVFDTSGHCFNPYPAPPMNGNNIAFAFIFA